MNNRSKPVGHWITGLAAAMVQSCDIQRKHENFEIFLSPSPVEKIFFSKKKFKKIFKVIFYTFWTILSRFEQKYFFDFENFSMSQPSRKIYFFKKKFKFFFKVIFYTFWPILR